MSNPNNCETCEYKELNDDPKLHCYMFKDAPTEVCMQHTGRISFGAKRLTDQLLDALEELRKA